MPNPNMTYEELRKKLIITFKEHHNLLPSTSYLDDLMQLFATLGAEIIPEDKPYIDGTTTYDSLILESSARRILRKEVLARVAQLTTKNTEEENV